MSPLKVPGKTDVVMTHLHQVQDVVFSSGTFDWNISALLPFLMATVIPPLSLYYCVLIVSSIIGQRKWKT